MGSAQPPFSPSAQLNLIERHDKLVKSNFERMQSYSKVIIGLAYAGLLAVWSSTKQVLPEWQLVASGLLIILSILAYVIFEVGQMIFYTWMSWRYSADVGKRGLAGALSRSMRSVRRDGSRFESPEKNLGARITELPNQNNPFRNNQTTSRKPARIRRNFFAWLELSGKYGFE
jgi:hypothetical protein